MPREKVIFTVVALITGFFFFAIGAYGVTVLQIQQGGSATSTVSGSTVNGLQTGKVLIGNGTGGINVVPYGTSGQVLKSNGSGVAPSFQASASIPPPDLIYRTLNNTKYYTASSSVSDNLAFHFNNGFISSGASSTLTDTLFLVNSNYSDEAPCALHLQDTTGQIYCGILPELSGGTGQNTYATGDILYANTTNGLTKLPIGTRGTILSVTTGGIPGYISTSTFAHLNATQTFTGANSFSGVVNASSTTHLTNVSTLALRVGASTTFGTVHPNYVAPVFSSQDGSVSCIFNCFGLRVIPTVHTPANPTGVIGVHSMVLTTNVPQTLTNAYDFVADTPTRGAHSAITNLYGFYANDLSNSSSTPYGFYSAGATDYNYFAGSTGIATTTPGRALSVSGGSLLDGKVDLWPTIPDIGSGAGTVKILSFDPTITFNDGNGTSAIDLMNFSPTINHNAGVVPTFNILKSNAIFNNSVSPFIYNLTLFNASIVSNGAATGTEPLLPDTFLDNTVVDQTAGNATSTFTDVALVAQSTVRVTNGGSWLNLTGTTASVNFGGPGSSIASLFSHPTFTATGVAGRTAKLSIQTRQGAVIYDVTTSVSNGIIRFYDNIGVDVGTMVKGRDHNIGFRSFIAASSTKPTANYAFYGLGTAPSYFGGNIGIASTSPWGLLTVDQATSTASKKPIFVVGDNGTTSPFIFVTQKGNTGIGTTSLSLNDPNIELTVDGRITFGGKVPTLHTGTGNCGTGATVTGTDIRGRVTLGTVVASTQCNVNFNKTTIQKSVCFSNNETHSLLIRAIASTTGFSLHATSTLTSGDVISYWCPT